MGESVDRVGALSAQSEAKDYRDCAYDQKDMESFFHTNADEIKIIYNGVDTKRYNGSLQQRMRGQLRNQWGVSENDVIFLFVSYDLKKKGIEPLVAAAAKLKRLEMTTSRFLLPAGSLIVHL